jgi:hypothetical protein
LIDKQPGSLSNCSAILDSSPGVQQLTRSIRRIRHAGWLLPGTLTGYL